MDDDEYEYVAPTVATWWIPLPEPISLESDEILTYVVPRKTAEMPRDSQAASIGDVRLKYEIDVRFHQQKVRHGLSLGLKAAAAAAYGAAGAPASAEAGPDREWQRATVAEASVALHGIHEPDFDNLTDAFDAGLEIVQHIQRAYAIAARVPMVIIEYERLPTFLPYSLHRGDGGSPEPQGLYMLGYNEVAAYTEPVPLTPAARSTFDFMKEHADGPFMPSMQYYCMHKQSVNVLATTD
ncbi:hypothetical protein V2J56_08190, partial [Georgenia sp. MJ206]|uniref:hypothetical protein n=1 Tax=Georgenia wangjunii TaxID=3117730 RepID=UPI002F26CA7B